MDRNREVRRGSMAAAANGLSRRRHRSGSLRDSPDEDGPVELPESGRLRDRGLKKERDRERDRDRSSRSSKRRRADRLMQGSIREEGVDDSSEESVNGEDDDEDDDGSAGAGSARMLSPNPSQSISPSISNHNHNLHRKIFPPSSTNKVFRAPPAWKAADEMIGVLVPRKARSASTKRSHDCWTAGGGGAVEDQIHRQASTSPVRQNLASTSTPSPAPVSPSSSNASMRKKTKLNGAKLRPPKASSKTSSNPEELEIEIAEVLYGLMTQSQGPPTELNKASGDAKSRVSSPISNSPLSAHQSTSVLPHNSTSFTPPTAVAPKRKRPRQVSDDLGRGSPMNSKAEMDLSSKKETLSPSFEKNPGSTAENGVISQDLCIYPVGRQQSEPQLTEPARPDGSGSLLDLMKTLKQGTEPNLNDESLAAAAASTSPKKESSSTIKPVNQGDLTLSEIGTHYQEKKFQIDLMAPPPPPMKSSPPERVVVGEEKEKKNILLSLKDKEDDKIMNSGKTEPAECEEVQAAGPTGMKMKVKAEEDEGLVMANRLQFDLENPERETSKHHLHPSSGLLKQQHKKPVRDEPAQSISISMSSWTGLSPMGYMAPMQGGVSMDGASVATPPMQPLFSQPRPKSATHAYIAANISYFQQLAKMNPFWPPAAAGTPSIFGAKPCNLAVVPPADLHRRNATQQEKNPGLTIFPGVSGGPESKACVNSNDSNQRTGSSKQQHVLQQPTIPQPPAPSSVLPGPAFIFPLGQQHSAPATSARPASVKSSSTGSSTASIPGSTPPPPPPGAPANGLNFNYPNIPVGSEPQYLAILQNGYPFPIPTVGGGPAYRGTPHPQSMAYFNGPFYSSQMIHPSQFQQQQQPVVIQQQSSCPSSTQKQSRPANSNSSIVSGSGNIISFPHSGKDRSQPQPQSMGGGDDIPENNRLGRPPFGGPVHHQNFALMNPPSTDKKQILKGNVESLPQNFAISFSSMKGVNGGSGLDMPQNLQSLPETTRHGYQMMAAAAAASQGVQQMKNFRIHEDGKSDQSGNNMDEEKKLLMKTGQTIAFSRPELGDRDRSSSVVSGSSVQSSNPKMQAQMQFQQLQQQQQMQLMQLQKQQQQHQMATASATRNKGGGGGSSAAYTSDRSAKFPGTALSPYPQNHLVQSGSSGGSAQSPANSPQWKNSRAGSPQVPSSLGSSSSSIKNISQQQQQVQGQNQGRSNQTQISFSANSKSSMAPQSGQQQPTPINNHQSAAAASAQCPPVMVGSPTTSSLSKGASGSPRTTNSNSTGNKPVQPSSLSSSQQSKTSSASQSQKTSSVVSGQSVLGAHQMSSSQSNNSKPQNPSSKQQMLQPHLFFNTGYIQAAQVSGPPPATSSPSASAGGYYMQKRRPDQQNQQTQSTSAMLSLCPANNPDIKGAAATTTAGTNTNSTKGGGGGGGSGQFPAQSVVGGNPHPLIPPGFYGHTIPSAAIQVKPPEQKQQQAGGK